MNFPHIYKSVKRFLSPTQNCKLPNFSRSYDSEYILAKKHPEDVLDMLDRITSDTTNEISYQINEILPLIIEAKAELEEDPRFQRLTRLQEKI